MLISSGEKKIVLFSPFVVLHLFSPPPPNHFLYVDALTLVLSPSVSVQTVRESCGIFRQHSWHSRSLCLTFHFCRNYHHRAHLHRPQLLLSWASLNCRSRCVAMGTKPPLSCPFTVCQPVAGGPFGAVGSGCWQRNLSHCRLRLCHAGRSGLGRVIYFTRHFAQRQEKAIGAECQQLPALPIFSIWTGTTFRT